ncbi:MAG TPA: penicillin-binding protein 1C [Chitinophagaceae bacterium]|nr:penicillin-binding protein 1C [Chitinophagaceae bacterium]
MRWDLSKQAWRRRIRRLGMASLSLLAAGILLNWIFPLPDRVEYSTVITDSQGRILHAYLTRDQQWRLQTGLSEISPLLRKAIVAKEDRYFYWHFGVNPLAVARALWRNLLSGRRTSGASTITMQVARALEPKPRTWGGKLVEMFRACQLEWKYSKEEILQLYLNLVPYGGNIQGVKAASRLYFQKNPDHLSLAEITALCILPNRPSSLRIGQNNDRIVQARNRWLIRFSRQGLFPEKVIRDALAEPLTATRGVMPFAIPHLAGRLRTASRPAVITFIDLNTQQKTETLIRDYVRTERLRGIRNAAAIIVDNRTHRVITYVGSSDFRDTLDGGQVNGAAAIREPGSTLKPLLYGLCFDKGLLTPKTVMTDVAVDFQGYAPENYDRQFHGYVSVEYALEHSLNIPAVKALHQLGKDQLVQQLAACGFRGIARDRSRLGLSLILGGCGTTLEELTGLFSVFANQGIYYAPAYSSLDSSSNGRRILSPAACFMVNEILSRVNRPDFPLNWQATEHLPKIAWKTGTSYGRRDAWSIGYNAHYTVGVWVGNFSGVGAADLSGANVATPLLFRIFNTLDYNSDAYWFTQPPDCDQRQVCTETGLLPGDHCTHRVLDYYIPLVSSSRVCSNYQEIAVSPDGKYSYCRYCTPAAGYRKAWFRIVEPDMQAWYRDHGLPVDQVPPHNPACEHLFRDNGPQIISPSPGMEYLINARDPEPLQLACRAANDVSRVYWYVDNRFYKASSVNEKPFFLPQEGPVKISCTDDKGRNQDIRIRVRYLRY